MKIIPNKNTIISFVWQHILLLISLFIMTLGVAICVRSMLGSSVISTIPYVFETAGRQKLGVPALTIGQYTYIMNALLVLGQVAVLRKKFEPVQLTQWLTPGNLPAKIISQIVGCTVLGAGIAFEVRCGSVTMPGEGFPVAIGLVSGMPFHKVKIIVDTSMVILAIVFCYIFFGAWQWYIVGIGTLFAMIYVGMVVRTVGKHLAWFDRLLAYRPGFRRYVYGLARLIFRQR